VVKSINADDAEYVSFFVFRKLIFRFSFVCQQSRHFVVILILDIVLVFENEDNF
jgi:hypothetical protein